jgi:hypothetical protein
MEDEMHQVAPFPHILGKLVTSLGYKAGWTFRLVDLDRGQGSKGLTLVINITGPNSYRPWEKISVNHYMLVPPAAYDMRSWRRWLLDQVLLVERHEACEFFRLHVDENDQLSDTDSGYADRPYAPSHGPGNDPYLIREVGSELDQRTSFRGEVNG